MDTVVSTTTRGIWTYKFIQDNSVEAIVVGGYCRNLSKTTEANVVGGYCRNLSKAEAMVVEGIDLAGSAFGAALLRC